MTHITLKAFSVLSLLSAAAQAAAPAATQGLWSAQQVLCNGAVSASSSAVQSMKLSIAPSQVQILSPMPASEGRQCRGSLSLQVLGDDPSVLQLGNGQFAIECLANDKWESINSGALSGQKQYLLHVDAVDAGSLRLSSQVDQASAFGDCQAGQTATLVLKRD